MGRNGRVGAALGDLRDRAEILGLVRRAIAGRARRAAAGPEAAAAWRRDRQAELRTHAAARSPFHRRRLAGLEGAPLAELPVLTKAELMADFDEAVTDPAVRLADLERFVEDQRLGARYQGRYRVAATSGSVGRPGVFLWDRAEWAGMLAAAAAARQLAGPPAVAGRGRVRSAKVASPLPTHMSLQLGSTLSDPRRPTLRLSALTPVPQLAAELDRWQPHVLNAVPSLLSMLAEEQLAGRLAIAPSRVFGGAEPLTASARARIAEAWGEEPFDQYVTTEASHIAGECAAHGGMHVLDDHVVLEVVDEQHRPVPPGTFGSSVLVTVLGSRTLPLLRYELTDSLRLATEPCPCGRTSPVIAEIQGRVEEVVHLPGPGGDVAVSPLVFTRVLDLARVAGWQVVREPARIRVLVVGPRDGFSADDLAERLRRSLADLDVVAPPLVVDVVEAIPRGRSGKAPLVTTADAAG
jgi:phenylacetate-coenzyme A ligase PaaK-like adenylate-forming protein